MYRSKRLAILAIACGLAVSAPAFANPIERACNQSGRETASRALCGCIGDAADQTLNRRQMREGARWFDDPQRAQDVRQSDRRSDERMWQAWRSFGETAEAMCS